MNMNPDEGQLKSLGLSDRVVEALHKAEIRSIRALSLYTKQELIDIPGVGATSAGRILEALDGWFEESMRLREPAEPITTTLEVVPDTAPDSATTELFAACLWAQEVFARLGRQRGQHLAGLMKARIDAVQEKLPEPLVYEEDFVTEVVKIG